MTPPRTLAPATPIISAPGLKRLDVSRRDARVVIAGVEGVGKTSIPVFGPNAAIIMAKGETGYMTLLQANRAPSVDATLVNTWDDLFLVLDGLIAMQELPYNTLGLDARGGFEQLCHQHVCSNEFDGDWGEKGFTSFQRGYKVAQPEWLKFLAKLDAINAKGCAIFMLAHTVIKPFRNPLGADYDRIAVDAHEKTWGPTHKWADAVLFYTFVTVVEKLDRNKTKGKAIGGTDRVIYTERRDAWDAKNRYGMPESLDIPDDPSQTYNVIMNAIKGGK